MAYKNKMRYSTSLEGVEIFEGETLENKLDRILNNGEAIEDTAPIIYEPRDKGVNPSHNIRTDRFEMARRRKRQKCLDNMFRE